MRHIGGTREEIHGIQWFQGRRARSTLVALGVAKGKSLVSEGFEAIWKIGYGWVRMSGVGE